MHLSTGSFLLNKRRTRSVCILLHEPLCLLQQEQYQHASFYTILSVCYNNNNISVRLSTGSFLFLTRRTRSVCILLHELLCLLQQEQYQHASFYRILSVCYKKYNTSVHLSTGSSPFVTRIRISACIFLQEAFCLLQE